MKKTFVYIMIIALFVAGIGCIAGALASVDFNFDRLLDNGKTFSKDYEFSSDGAIDIISDYHTVNIVQSKDDKLRVCTKQNDKVTFDVSFESGTLQIAVKGSYDWIDHVALYTEHTVIVEIPASCTAVNVTMSAAFNLSVNTLTANELNILVDRGHIDLYDCDIKTLSAINMEGSIDFSNLAADNITIKATKGNISGTIKGDENVYAVTASAPEGNSNLKNRAGGSKSLIATATSGKIEIFFSL